jgi:hypothetical protein
MSRTLIIVALVGLLVGCTAQGDGEPDASVASTASATASAPGTTSGAASAACAEAFAPLVEMDISSMSELGDLPAEVQPTVEACESVADWMAGADEVIGGQVNPGSADFLLRVHCGDLSLARTPICEELG